MTGRRTLWLFAGTTGLVLAIALTVNGLRPRPRDQTERATGPSAIDEGEKSLTTTYRGPSSYKSFGPSNREPQTPSIRPKGSKRPPGRRTADTLSGEGAAPKRAPMVAPPQRYPQPSSVPPGLPEAAAPQPPSENRPEDDALPVAPPSETTGPALSPPLPPILIPPVLLTEPVQDSGDQQVILERGQLTIQLRLVAREGRVVLRILVRADGRVGRSEVARSSGQSALDQAAVTAASSWRFDPATKDGTPIDAWVLVPVRFIVR